MTGLTPHSRWLYSLVLLPLPLFLTHVVLLLPSSSLPQPPAEARGAEAAHGDTQHTTCAQRRGHPLPPHQLLPQFIHFLLGLCDWKGKQARGDHGLTTTSGGAAVNPLWEDHWAHGVVSRKGTGIPPANAEGACHRRYPSRCLDHKVHALVALWRVKGEFSHKGPMSSDKGGQRAPRECALWEETRAVVT